MTRGAGDPLNDFSSRPPSDGGHGPAAGKQATVEPKKPASHQADPNDDPMATDDETMRRADALDPDVRRSLDLGPPPFVNAMPCGMQVLHTNPTNAAVAPTSTEPRTHATLEELLPALVRKIAWGGNGQRGSVRMELGAGKLSGATVVVHADDGKVRVEVSAPSGADPAEWRRRIDARLREQGLDVESVEVT